MKIVEIMMAEHQNILKMLKVVRQTMIQLMTSDHICEEDVRAMFDFVKQYADAHHHGKEEIYLFEKMIEEIGPVADKLVNQGMLVEHDLGRLYVSNTLGALEAYLQGDKDKKIDIIAGAMAYVELLHRHIDKEDNVVFPLAERTLSPQTKEGLDEKANAFELEFAKRSQDQLLALEALAARYL